MNQLLEQHASLAIAFYFIAVPIIFLSTIIAGITACMVIYLAFVHLCMGFGWIFGKLVLDPIEYLFTLIFRRRHASA